MSGIFLETGFTDESALQYFMTNSITSVLHYSSMNAIILELQLNPDFISPYQTIYYNDSTNTINIKPIFTIVFKLVIINNRDKLHMNPNPVIKVIESYPEKYTTTKFHFESEIAKHKLIFYDSYMVDFQLRAVCPDIICSFFIKKFDVFFNALTFISGVDRKNIYDYINAVRSYDTYVLKNLYLGCIVMEKINAIPLNRFCISTAPFYKNLNKSLHEAGESYQELLTNLLDVLISKAFGIINLDKMHYIGYSHNDYIQKIF